MQTTEHMESRCWRNGADSCAERSRRGNCCRDREFPSLNIDSLLSRWLPVVSKTHTGLAGFAQVARSIAKEFGPTDLDKMLSSLSANGERDYCEGLRRQIAARRSSLLPRPPRPLAKLSP